MINREDNVTRDLFLLASLGILKFIPAAGRNGRRHWSRVFFTVRGGTGDEFGGARGARTTLGFNELFRSPLVPPLKPPF